MYELFVPNKKIEKRLREYIRQRPDIPKKLDRLKLNPRGECGAHPLHGELSGKWSCWLGSDVRMIYAINDNQKRIEVETVGSHKIY